MERFGGTGSDKFDPSGRRPGKDSLFLSSSVRLSRASGGIKEGDGSFEFESAFRTEPSEDSCSLSKPYRSYVDGSSRGAAFEGDGVTGIESRGSREAGLRGDHAGLPGARGGVHRLAQIGTLSVLHVHADRFKNRMTRAPSPAMQPEAALGLLNDHPSSCLFFSRARERLGHTRQPRSLFRVRGSR